MSALHTCPACGYGPQVSLALASTSPKRGRIKAQLRLLLKACGPQGLTVDDLERLTHVGHQSVSARVHELGRAGEIRPAERRRATRSGKLAVAWVAAEPVEGLAR